MKCPACGEGEGQLFREHSAEAAAEHFVPRDRDAARHDQLVSYLRQLWSGRDFVETHVCPQCGFGFAVPWVGGDKEFYALIHQGDPHYPRQRWEFKRTISVLSTPPFSRPLRLAEVGAGDGAFLSQVRTLPHGPEHEMVAADFDRGAVKRLTEKGFSAVLGSFAEVRDRYRDQRFDVVCLFQTLEHIADLDEVFGELYALLGPHGSVFLSVPNGEATTLQEDLTGFWDMPPYHVGRWNPRAIHKAAERRRFDVVSVEGEPVNQWATTMQLAVYSVNGNAYEPRSIAARINAIGFRPLRGVLKRVLMFSEVPRLLSKRRQFRPLTYWAHLRAHWVLFEITNGEVSWSVASGVAS